MPSDRRQARVLAMQALSQWDVQREESPEALHDTLANQDAPPASRQYATQLVQRFWQTRESVDGRIAAATQKWEFSRISSVERNTLRVAVVEFDEGSVPPRVVLNEAIEIGRAFGGADSPRFVNGVLDKVLKSAEETKAGED